MNKKILLAIPVVALAVFIPMRSHAFGGESLGCFVNVGTPGVFSSPTCGPTTPKFTYNVVFKVLNQSGAYSYAWNTSGLTVSSGCTSTSDTCILTVRTIQGDQALTVSVAITQSGQSSTLSATAEIPAVCILGSTPVYC
jgi:hypothetical protein